MPDKKWMCPLDDSEIQKIEPESLQFILNQAEKAILSTKEAFYSLQNKALTILTVLFPIVTTLVGAFYYFINVQGDHIIEIASLMGFTVPLVVGIIYCSKIVFPQSTNSIGNIPENLLIKDIVPKEKNEGNKMKKYKELLVSECENYKEIYDQMSTTIKKSSKYLKISIISIFLSPVSAIIVYLFLNSVECFSK